MSAWTSWQGSIMVFCITYTAVLMTIHHLRNHR